VSVGPSSRAKVVWALLDQAQVSGCTFLVTLLVARFTSVADFSAYGLLVTVCLFISAMHRAYLTQPMGVEGVRELATALGRRFKAVLVMHLMAWPLVLALLLGLGWRYFPSVAFSIAAFAYVSAYLLQELVRRLFIVTDQHKLVAKMDMAAYGGQLLCIAAVGLLVGVNVTGALLIGGATFLASFIWAWFQVDKVYRRSPMPEWRELRLFALGHWQSSRWICFSQVFMFGSFMLVPFQIAEFGSVLWVAQYNAVGSVLNVLNILRQTMGNHLPILASRVFHNRGIDAFVQMMNRLSAAVLLVSTGVVLVLLLCGDALMALLYGARYAEAASVLPMASIGPLVAMVSFVSQAGGLALGQTRHIFFSYVAGMACSGLLAPFLIPTYGLTGAVWVANAGYIVPTIWHWWVFKRDCRAMRKAEMPI
jgi:O-antigen/teichoic acid export membrane protein